MKMTRYALLVAWLITGVLVWRALPSAGTAAAADGLTVPPGFEIERVAGPPLVTRPIVADFDERGRLYVADSSGSNEKVDVQLAERTHRIVRLEDRDGDGRYDTSVVFADRMMFPEGTMWLDGSLYVAAPPSIWKLTDTDDDGVADRREEWFQGRTLTGCANDLHGPYQGLDGWIYWTKGAFAEQTYERPGRTPFVTRASHIFRRRPGDSAIEPVMTGGMDNPVDVAFTAAGERIFTATFLEHPQLGRRDALVHAVYGGVYGKPHAVIDNHVRTGDLMPVLVQLGPAVPSGLTRYESGAFGSDYRDTFFAAMFNLRKVSRFVLAPDGATFKTRESDFVVSDNRDFHPTDVLEDADGSLLVVDTGPWYKLCCPTSQIAKPDVPGAIYRVRRQGTSPGRDVRGLQLAWNTMSPVALVGLLNDERPFVRKRAIQELGRRGTTATTALEQAVRTSQSVEARRNAVWALTRIDEPAARVAVRAALGDRDDSVRQAALHSIAAWRDRPALPPVVAALNSGSPSIQRTAAEAIGRLGEASAVAPLIAAAGNTQDRVLEHSLTYALIEIGDPAATLTEGLQATSSRARRAALIARDQMTNGGLKPEDVVAMLESDDAVLKETAWWISGRHPEWGAALVPVFERQLEAASTTRAMRDDLQQRLAQFGSDGAMQAFLAGIVSGSRSRPSGARAMALGAMGVASRRLKELPPAWVEPLTAALGDPDPDLAQQAIAVVRGARASDRTQADLRTALLNLARSPARPIGLRLDALGAIPGRFESLDPQTFTLLRGGLAHDQPVVVRAAAAGVIERATLDHAQLAALTDTLRSIGPLELSRVLPAFDHGSDEALGLQMIAALEQSPGRSSLRPDLLRPRLTKYPETVKRKGEALLASIHVNSAGQAQRLEELLPAVASGDVRRGQAVFNDARAGCLTCHAIGYIGGKVGPDLTRIGQVRSERDLLEAIVFPSVSFARSYEPMIVRTRAGAVYNGVLRGDQADEVVLATGAVDDTRISRSEIADIRPGDVSVMPAGYADQLTRQELADLIAFLKAAK
jgi:putative membrane-bound dehydrogenase-like protein